MGVGSFFILYLVFDQARALVQKWLFFGIATMMTMAVLITMTTIAIDMTLAVGGAFWVTNQFGLGSESLMSMALQQGGLGMILSALIITAPPMAGMFFNGVMVRTTAPITSRVSPSMLQCAYLPSKTYARCSISVAAVQSPVDAAQGADVRMWRISARRAIMVGSAGTA